MHKLKFQKIFDFTLLTSVLILTTCGIIFIYSAGVNAERASAHYEYSKQIVWAVISVLAMTVFALINYNIFYRYSPHILAVSIAVLMLILLKGRISGGARSWIGIFGFGIQPSELTKISYTLFLAWYLERSENEQPFKRFAISLISLFIPMGVILVQPDFGTASVFIAIFLVACFMANIKAIYLVSFVGCGVLAVILAVLPELYKNSSFFLLRLISNSKFHLVLGLGTFLITVISLIAYKQFKVKYWYYIALVTGIICASLILSFGMWKVFQKYEYQIKRLLSFINPEKEKLGSGWQIINSKNSIGSGGLFGRGFLNGHLTQANFLPEATTDFIFSIFCEEMGFAGGIVIFLAYMLLFMRTIYIIKQTTSKYACYIASGILGMFFYHFMINVGMTMGLMPITGIPLPFLSYGGSSLLTSMIAVGILMSINYRRLDF
ncbi:MAG: rod shape-determining protein RodA [Treponema sp.]|nr:rod shape-determining protein RodA [Treponema sp.]